MKKLTPFLFCLLVLLVAAVFALNYIGALVPVFGESKKAASVQNEQPAEEVETTESEAEVFVLPSYYNCMDAGKMSKTRNQGELGSCWAFAVTAALESRLLPEEQWDFSEDHMLQNNGFAQDAYLGGDYFMAAAYLSAWKGPVPEEADPYNDGFTNTDAEAVKHVQEIMFISDADIDVIKNMIYTYGAVESAVYMAVDENQYIDENYYNRNSSSYCYDGDEESNHELVIVGWDDSWSMSEFNTGADKDGAFICMNSWGSDFGDSGIFYVSYCDHQIGKNIEVYSRIEAAGNYDHIYQYDDQGWVGRMGFEEETSYFANVYTAEGAEILKAVSFYATGDNTSYKVYTAGNVQTADDMNSTRELCAQGRMDYAGYYTVKLDKTIEVDPGERIAVIVEINTPDSLHPVAIEMDSEEGRTAPVVTQGRESYISADGKGWVNTQEYLNCNVCLKAFTDNR